MRRRVRVAALVLAAGASGGCTDVPDPGTINVVDSAGVRIVTNPPGSIETAEARSLSDAPVASFGGGLNPDVAFSEVAAVVPFDSGRVAVGVNGPPQVLVIGSDGALDTTLGREGEGPGEFFYVGSVVPFGGDSIAVWDPDRRRMSVFTSDGRYVRDVDLSALAPLSYRQAPGISVASGWSYLLPSKAGSLVLFAEGMFGGEMISRTKGVGRAELPSYRITHDGEELARLGPFPGLESYFHDELGVGVAPFGARPYAAASGDALVVGTAEDTEFRRYAPTGELEQIVRWPDHDRTVGGSFLARWSEMVDTTELRQVKEQLPRAERFPAYEGLIGTDTREIWVGAYPGPLGIWPIQPKLRMPARRWLVFSAEGELTASVQTPEGFQPYAVHEGRVWGVFTDEYDTESIRAYELVSGGP